MLVGVLARLYNRGNPKLVGIIVALIFEHPDRLVSKAVFLFYRKKGEEHEKVHDIRVVRSIYWFRIRR